MNYSFRNSLCLLLCAISSFAVLAQEPQQIKGIAKEDKSQAYYEKQSKLWQAEIQKDKKNTNAWNNYYRAERAKLQLTKPELWPGKKEEFYKLLDPIIADARAHIGNSYDYYLIRGMNSNIDSSIESFRKAYEIDFELWPTSIVFNKKHRIRVAVTSSNYPRFDLNPGTGRPWQSIEESVRQVNQIFCNAQRASHIVLPVVSSER